MKKKEEKMNKDNMKGQAWSIDIVIGVVLFLILLAVVYTLVATSTTGNIELRRNADIIHTTLDKTRTNNPGTAFISGNVIDPDELEVFMAKQYDEIKNSLGITGDFCIVITYVNEGIYNTTDKMTFGKPDHNLVIGRDEIGQPIYCGN
jgi:hypothetical protein